MACFLFGCLRIQCRDLLGSWGVVWGGGYSTSDGWASEMAGTGGRKKCQSRSDLASLPCRPPLVAAGWSSSRAGAWSSELLLDVALAALLDCLRAAARTPLARRSPAVWFGPVGHGTKNGSCSGCVVCFWLVALLPTAHRPGWVAGLQQRVRGDWAEAGGKGGGSGRKTAKRACGRMRCVGWPQKDGQWDKRRDGARFGRVLARTLGEKSN
ncbi:hypothetical protein B0T16DRAFT_234533 [Cercophora newfieldiana]|uniref:Uncharacterized protein n=1 Tax=Cercophora newfieldiana TaxID=92897 RepID=A0AA39XRR3_9PEZI|nr:hypothetical protein B0T16DRAFT_234533 [Cercophora newfieldiana]